MRMIDIAPRLAVVFPVLAVAIAPACDLFGEVACQDDGDCPDNVPFCVDDVCAEEEDDDRGGRGIDNCDADDDCPGFLCDIDGTFVEAGSCLPPEETEDCTELTSARPRDPLGPVIFDLVAVPFTGKPGAWSSIELKFVDREGDVGNVDGVLVEIIIDGAAQTQGGGASDTDGDTVKETVQLSTTFVSAPPDAKFGIQLLDDAGHPSNTICLPAEGSPAP